MLKEKYHKIELFFVCLKLQLKSLLVNLKA